MPSPDPYPPSSPPGQGAPAGEQPLPPPEAEPVPTPAAPGSATGTIDPPRPAAPGSGGQDDGIPAATATGQDPVDKELMLDGRVRQGAFLAGPGSLRFILHHSILGGVGGLVTMGVANGFRLDVTGAREAMLAGTLIGAGLGFGVSAWWQFNNWLDSPVATFGIVNSLVSGMAMTGLFNLFTRDPSTLAWTALIGAELGAWLTVGLGGGDFSFRKGVGIASAAGWGAAYAALFLAIVGTSSSFPDNRTVVDTLLIAPGVGALAMALASLKFDPSAAQVIRANLFGAGVGGGVLLLSALVLGGFNTATPYVLSLLSSALAITAVSVFWVEAAEYQPKQAPVDRTYRRVLYRAPDKHRPYANPWW
ncbi:MAG: hypothetical protein M3Y59_24455 [Myxococcota bacterium]|nr:hypothetical protein [Myxococcota bacterium]